MAAVFPPATESSAGFSRLSCGPRHFGRVWMCPREPSMRCKRGNAMFNTLDEEIENAKDKSSDGPDLLIRTLLITVISTVLFGALVLAIWFLG